MRRLLMIVLAGVALESSLFGQASDPAPATEAELRRLNDEWGRAILHKDLSLLSRILADDYVAITERGEVVEKQRVLRENASPDLVFQSVSSDDVRVRVFANTAIVTGRLKMEGRFKDQDISGVARYTDVYVKRTGQWVAVAEQITMVPPDAQ